MFWIKDKHGITGKVYDIRVEKTARDDTYTLFLIYRDGSWLWVDSDDYSPL